MNETSAREVLLLQTLESSGAAAGALWTAQDSAWASRAAQESVDTKAPDHRFISARAHHAARRLDERNPALGAWRTRRLWRAAWWAWAALVGLVAGLLADVVGTGRHIDLLAPPMWGVVAWNLIVYALLLWNALRAVALRRLPRPGPLAGLVQRWLAPLRPAGPLGEPGAAGVPGVPEWPGVLQQFSLAWWRLGAPLSATRAAGLLHLAAAALALGLIAGLYARGLVLDYRAGWESTFLTAAQVHRVLAVLLGPALALSGMALPDAAALDGMRLVPGAMDGASNAAPWIHLYALTLGLLVVLPRSMLALACAVRAALRARRISVPLQDAYFQRLLRHRRGGAAQVQVLPYAQAPGPRAEAGMRAVFGRLHGEAVPLHVAPVTAFGAEDDVAAPALVPPGTSLLVALFDLTATPEAEHQGRFIEALTQAAQAAQPAAGSGARPGVVTLVDEAAFVQRFGPGSERLAQRRAAWQALAQRVGTSAVFVDLSAPDLAAAEAALQPAAGAARAAATAA